MECVFSAELGTETPSNTPADNSNTDTDSEGQDDTTNTDSGSTPGSTGAIIMIK